MQPAPSSFVSGRMVTEDVLIELHKHRTMPVILDVRLHTAGFRAGMVHDTVHHLMTHSVRQPRQLVCAVHAISLQRTAQ